MEPEDSVDSLMRATLYENIETGRESEILVVCCKHELAEWTAEQI